MADEDVSYWLGYILISWLYKDNCKPIELLRYDWEKLYWGYDVLHTQSIDYIINTAKEKYILDRID